MAAHQSNLDKVALMAELVRRAASPLGRTALMKLAYFLKTLRGVPLEYDFRLYTYGPFDSDVLDDLQYASALGAVTSEITNYPGGGRGYQYRQGSRIGEVTDYAKAFISRHEESINWVHDKFGSRSPRELEMASTIVFVDREAAEKGSKQDLAELSRKVKAVKPYLPIGAIEQEARALNDEGLLSAVA